MKITELDRMFPDVNLQQMIEGIGMDMDDYAHYAWDTVGKSQSADAADFARVCALIGFMYGLKQTGGANENHDRKHDTNSERQRN